jgi:hypothetical protein
MVGRFFLHTGENMWKEIMTRDAIDDLVQIHLTDGKESTHSDQCHIWHIKCALFRVIQAYEELRKEMENE